MSPMLEAKHYLLGDKVCDRRRPSNRTRNDVFVRPVVGRRAERR